MVKSLSCIIVDDEDGAHVVLKHYLESFKYIEVAGSFFSALEALQYLHQHHVDLMFLDVNMPGITGLQMLKSLSNPPLVILTTAYREHALESYEYRVVDYLVKPFGFQRFFQAVDNALSRIPVSATAVNVNSAKNESFSIMLKVDGGMIRIDGDKILYIQSLGNYVKVYTEKETYLSLITTSEIEQRLDSGGFLRIHKSFIVSIAKIRKITGTQLEMANGTVLPIGNTYRRELMEKFR